jgi:hypothetical protein
MVLPCAEIALQIYSATFLFKGAEHGFVDQDLVRHGENKAEKKDSGHRNPATYVLLCKKSILKTII